MLAINLKSIRVLLSYEFGEFLDETLSAEI